MNNKERILKFLKDVGTYYIATVDNGKARVRPFGTINLFEDKLYFQSRSPYNLILRNNS